MSVSTPAKPRHRVLVIDNVDSFTWSLAMLFRMANARVHVSRGESLKMDDRRADLVVLSPGPGRPEEHPVTMAFASGGGGPVFGVCLGLQAIALAFGGQVGAAREIIHGRTSRIFHTGAGCFVGIPSPFVATRYHSLAVTTVPDALEVTAWTDDGEVMGLRHREMNVEGVQFHPESVRTRHGQRLVANVLGRLKIHDSGGRS